MVLDHPQEIHQVFKIIKRLSNPHNDDVGYSFVLLLLVQMQLYFHNLFYNLATGQVTAFGKQPARTEAASDIAAYLSCDTHRQTEFMPHQNRFYQIAILQLE